MTDEFETQLTDYLIDFFSDHYTMPKSMFRVEYVADEERTTVIIGSDHDWHYDCIAGSDDDAFHFINREFPDDSVDIPFPPFFND